MEYKEYNEKDLQSFEYETTIQSDGKIIGVCELGKATIQMINDSNNYSVFKDSWIKTIHGSFYIYDVEPVQEKVNIKLSCYDIKYKLDTKYDKAKHIFPLTLKDWRNSIFEDCGLSYDNSDFPNSSLTLNEQPYLEEGCSNRDVIKMIAEAGCSTVINDNEDVIYFEWFDDITEPYEVIDWLELTTEREMSNPINTVVLGRGDTEDNVYYPNPKPMNPNEFRIDNNYILDPQEVDSDEDKRYDVIQNIYDRVNNFSYLIFNMRSQSINNKLSIKLGQKIKYKDIWNNDLIAYVMTKKITWLGGSLEQDDNYEITLSAEGLKESSTNFSYSSNIKNDILRVERKTDKNSGKIEDIIEQNLEFSTKMTAIDQTLDTISQTVSDIESLEREISNNNYIYIENAMQEQLEYLEIKGPFSLLYPSDDLYPNDDLYSLDSYLIIDKTKELSSDAIKIHLPLSCLKANERFIIEYGKTRIEKLDGTIEELEDIDIQLFEGENYIYLESFQNNDIKIYVKYIIKNSYTDKFATKAEMNSKITQTAEEINIEVSKKVNETEVVSKINQSAEQITLTSNRLVVDSNNFKLDEFGNMTCNDASLKNVNITNGRIKLTADSYDDQRIMLHYNNYKNNLSPNGMIVFNRDDNNYYNYYSSNGFNASDPTGHDIHCFTSGIYLFYNNNANIQLEGQTGNIYCNSLIQTSLESRKKNIEKLNDALKIIEETDIYKYHLKGQNDDEKKHIGFVIGDKFNYSKDITSTKNDGVDVYSMVAVCFKAIQEQQKIIEELKEMINNAKN